MSETVKLIIEIPKDMFEWFKNEEIIDEYDESALKQVFKNGIPLDDVKAEIEEKAFTEEIFDEDVFHSIFTESMTREEAEGESIIETEIVKLTDVLEIFDNIGKGGSEC